MNLTSLRKYVDTTLTATATLQKVGDMVMDPETLEYVPEYIDVYEGPVLIYAGISDPERPEAGGATYTVTAYTVVLPKETPVEVGHVLTVLEAPEAPETAGAVLRIASAPRQTWQVARVCYAEITQ